MKKDIREQKKKKEGKTNQEDEIDKQEEHKETI